MKLTEKIMKHKKIVVAVVAVIIILLFVLTAHISRDAGYMAGKESGFTEVLRNVDASPHNNQQLSWQNKAYVVFRNEANCGPGYNLRITLWCQEVKELVMGD